MEANKSMRVLIQQYLLRANKHVGTKNSACSTCVGQGLRKKHAMKILSFAFTHAVLNN